MSRRSDNRTCTANISFRGIPFPIRAVIDDWTASYLETCLQDRSPGIVGYLVQITDVEGRHLVFNTTFMNQLILVDWIRSSSQETIQTGDCENDGTSDPDGEEDDYPAALRIYFSGGNEPEDHFDISGLELDTINCLIDTFPLNELPMISFRDGDNDPTFVNPRNIILMEYHDITVINEFLESESVEFHYYQKGQYGNAANSPPATTGNAI